MVRGVLRSLMFRIKWPNSILCFELFSSNNQVVHFWKSCLKEREGDWDYRSKVSKVIITTITHFAFYLILAGHGFESSIMSGYVNLNCVGITRLVQNFNLTLVIHKLLGYSACDARSVSKMYGKKT